MGEPLRTRAELDAEAAQREGCVLLRRARATGTLVGLYRSDEAGMESDPESPWATVCEQHHAIVCHATRANAVLAMPIPHDWCDDCRVAHEAKEAMDATPDRR